MSRLRNYARGLASGYFVLAVNVVHTLVSIRLAWSFLPEEEFGVWTVSLMVAGYLAFIDLGTGAASARLLIDHKDDRSDGAYGGMIKTASLVFLTQGGIILMVGAGISQVLPSALRAPDDLLDEMRWLLFGLTALSAARFSSRIFAQLLHAHQRLDLIHVAGCVQLVVSLGLLSHGFLSGWGVFSLLAAHAGGAAASVVLEFLFCLRNGMLPVGSEWGRANRRQFREMFSFGADVFWIGLGAQIITTSHAVVLARALGGEIGVKTAAIWAVATKAFALVYQVTAKTLAISAPIFGEMHARGEEERLRDRHRVLFRSVNALTVWCAMLFAFCNPSFLEIWMKGAVRWGGHHDWLLAIWLTLLMQQGVHTALIMAMKRIGGLKTAILLEAVVFLLGGLLFFGRQGMDALIGWSIVCTLALSFSYTTLRVSRMHGVKLLELLWEWQKPALGMALLLGAVGWAVAGLCGEWGARSRFLTLGGVLLTVGAVYFGRGVLSAEWRAKIRAQTPAGLRPLLDVVFGRRVDV